MAVENFINYTEVDPNSKITVAASRVTWAQLGAGEDAYVYSDKGANYFAGNFEIQFTLRITAETGTNYTINGIWALTNLLDDLYGIYLASGDYLTLQISDYLRNMTLWECDGGTQYGSATSYSLTLNTDYYLTITRDESASTYGTLYCYIYSDFARTTLLSTLTRTLHTSKKDFQYLHTVITSNVGVGSRWNSGYTEALEIVSNTSTPVVSTQACTSITGTTATGNGTISSLGTSAITEHGHCWVTYDGLPSPTLPTTSDSKTENGAGSLGAFTSAITGLTQGVMYIVRAYAINTGGTSYGGAVAFIAGKSSTQLAPKMIAVGYTALLYTGMNGKRYYVQGVEF